MTNVFQNSKLFSCIQHTTAVVSYNILRLDLQIYFKLHYELELQVSMHVMPPKWREISLWIPVSFFLLESKLRFDSILVAKQAYAIDNEQGKLNRAESYKAR